MENYISKEGLENLKTELENLVKNKRPAVIERIATAQELGDLSENAEYHEARAQQSFIEGRVQELETLIKNAVIVKASKKTDSVGLGSTVHAICGDGRKIKYTIVGHSEADPMSGKISHESPLGQAFMGKAVGDKFELQIPAGKLECKIGKIE